MSTKATTAPENRRLAEPSSDRWCSFDRQPDPVAVIVTPRSVHRRPRPADRRGAGRSAKTGTAEYGTARPPRTHAWIISYTDDLAVAVMVADGQSVSGTAGPLLKKFLS